MDVKTYELTHKKSEKSFEFSILGEHREFNGCIQYVHELQHAFKLCGIEKEIIL